LNSLSTWFSPKPETVAYTLSGEMDWKCGVVGTKLITASKPDSDFAAIRGIKRSERLFNTQGFSGIGRLFVLYSLNSL
jgi:hypothetical protein